jgi:hypothetical protein
VSDEGVAPPADPPADDEPDPRSDDVEAEGGDAACWAHLGSENGY